MPYPYYQYQPYYGQMLPTQMSGANQQTNQDERIWVQGEVAAQSYLVAPNGFARLWDTTQNIYYEKRADASGRPYMEVYEYARKGGNQPNKAVSDDVQGNMYAEQIRALERRIEALEKGESNE